ncbi:MAG: type II toxin-antitoxin system VapC family toxin [Candidatus Dormibacteraeota bacterium]|nr:type II toxin-antitoxin system VapC family toxin [Candidatus Dormibacteraeota bacterium]
MIVLDASVLIAHLDADDAHHSSADQLLAETSPAALGASPITLAEVLVAPARTGRLDRANAALKRLGIDSVALVEDAPLRLAVLRAGTKLKLPDCCVLLAAETADASIATFDDRLATAARERGHVVVSRP